MKYKKIDDIWLIVLKQGETIIKSIKEFVEQANIKSGYFNAIGAVKQVELAFYNLRQKTYRIRLIKEALEIASLMGNVTRKDNSIIVHAHTVVSNDKMLTYGGHLQEATVAAACEIVFKEINVPVTKQYDVGTGLNLMDLE